ncbi:MAG: hypothetical protein H6550_12090 [Chitinophagales bacterium]|nr:hypothetical protein [Chitinophagales bacterium]
MNNKIKFILSRVVILTLMAGLASFVLMMIFKMLVMVLAVGLIVMAAKTFMNTGRHRGGLHYHGEEEIPTRHRGIVPVQQGSPFVPATARVRSAIIPIN